MKNTVNKRIKELRSALNLNQTDFARECEISHSLLSKIENGDSEVSFKVIDKITNTFGVDQSWLAQGLGEMSFMKPSKSATKFDPATDTLYKELKEQISFYRDLLKQMASNKSFLKPLNQTALKRGLSAAA